MHHHTLRPIVKRLVKATAVALLRMQMALSHYHTLRHASADSTVHSLATWGVVSHAAAKGQASADSTAHSLATWGVVSHAAAKGQAVC